MTARRLTRILVGSDGNGGMWKKVVDKVIGAKGLLDVGSVGGAGKYISVISETDGADVKLIITVMTNQEVDDLLAEMTA